MQFRTVISANLDHQLFVRLVQLNANGRHTLLQHLVGLAIFCEIFEQVIVAQWDCAALHMRG